MNVAGQPSPGPGAWSRLDTRRAFAVFGLALSLRLVLAAMTPVIGADAAAYLLFAREILQGVWAPSLELGTHPGYPVAIVLASSIAGGIEPAGYLVSALASSLGVALFYAWVRDVAGPRVACLSALLFACLPYFILEHADVMTEGLFQLLFVASTSLSWLAATRKRFACALGAGATGALAYYTRPEGVYTMIALLGLVLFVIVQAARARRPLPLRLVGFAAASVAVFIALIFPLLFWYRKNTGEWTLTKRGSFKSVTQAEPQAQETPAAAHPLRSQGWAPAAADYLKQMVRVTYYLLPLAAVGLLFFRKGMPGIAVLYALALSAGYSLPPLLARSHGYALSHRYVLTPALFLLPFVALACTGLADRASRRWGARRTAWVASLVLGLFLCAAALRAVHPRRTEDRPIREAALWLAPRLSADSTVRANTIQVWHYLGRKAEEMWKTVREVESLVPARGEYVFVIERDCRKDAPVIWRVLEERFRRIARFPAGGDEKVDTVSIFHGPKGP